MENGAQSKPNQMKPDFCFIYLALMYRAYYKLLESIGYRKERANDSERKRER